MVGKPADFVVETNGETGALGFAIEGRYCLTSAQFGHIFYWSSIAVFASWKETFAIIELSAVLYTLLSQK